MPPQAPTPHTPWWWRSWWAYRPAHHPLARFRKALRVLFEASREQVVSEKLQRVVQREVALARLLVDQGLAVAGKERAPNEPDHESLAKTLSWTLRTALDQQVCAHEAIRLLILAGANPNEREGNPRHATLLGHAVAMNQWETVELLLQAGGNSYLANDEGVTPWTVALQPTPGARPATLTLRQRVLELLWDSVDVAQVPVGPSMEPAEPIWWTSALYGDVEALRRFHAKGVDLTVRNTKGENIWSAMVQDRKVTIDEECARFVHDELKIEPRRINIQGDDALGWAIYTCQQPVAQWLADKLGGLQPGLGIHLPEEGFPSTLVQILARFPYTSNMAQWVLRHLPEGWWEQPSVHGQPLIEEILHHQAWEEGRHLHRMFPGPRRHFGTGWYEYMQALATKKILNETLKDSDLSAASVSRRRRI